MLDLLLLTSVLSTSPAQTPAAAVDAAAVRIGAPLAVAELDLGKLKGELRELSWSRDGSELYVKTADGNPGSQKFRHYIIGVTGGAPRSVEQEPEWATDYWGFKSDRFAPGLPSLIIGFEQKQEKMKIGTGSGSPAEQANAAPGTIPIDIEKTGEGQLQNYARLTFEGETISEFVNQMPIPGLMFSWGPIGSGAMAYTDREPGRLMLIDQHRHKQTISGVKDALLPAWSIDGARLAWVQKAGRKKYTLMWAPVSLRG